MTIQNQIKAMYLAAYPSGPSTENPNTEAIDPAYQAEIDEINKGLSGRPELWTLEMVQPKGVDHKPDRYAYIPDKIWNAFYAAQDTVFPDAYKAQDMSDMFLPTYEMSYDPPDLRQNTDLSETEWLQFDWNGYLDHKIDLFSPGQSRDFLIEIKKNLQPYLLDPQPKDADQARLWEDIKKY